MKRSFRTLLMTTMFVTALSAPALSQDVELQNMLDRMERMDRDLKALSLKVFRNAPVDSATAVTTGSTAGGEDVGATLGARLSVRINQLENQMRQMTGQVEETAYRISQLNTRLDKLVADVDYRLTALEGGTPVARPENTPADPAQNLQANGLNGTTLPPPGTSPQPGVLGTLNESDLVQTNPAGTPPTASQTGNVAAPNAPETQVATALSAEEQYEQARQLLLQGDPVSAEAGFKALLDQNNDRELTGKVRYWLGEAYYVRGQFTQAITTFLEGYQKDPRGAKAPDSLLKLGMSLKRMEKLTEACAAFSQLRADFPKMPAHISKTLERERTAAKCG